jgi:homopolymeric O-antigen transport system permease protein
MTATTPLDAGRAAARTARPPRPSIVQIVGEIWDARDLVVQFVLRDLTLRYVQAVMGFAWALLMPILIVGAGMMFRIVLSTLANSPLEGSSIASLAAKALPWAFFSGALSTATSSVIGNSNLISKVYFPREVLPLSTVIAQSPDLVIGLVVVASVMPFIDKGGLSWSGLWVIAVLLLLMLFTVGCALFLSCANLFFRDVKYIVQVLLNFGVFATPVFFEPQMLGPKGAAIMMVLPLSPFIQAMDVALVHGHSLASTVVVTSRHGDVVVWAPWMLAYAAGWTLVLVITGIHVFRSGSSRFAEMA